MATLPPEYRRSVVEQVAKYIAEPSLRDIFVEGESDAVVVRRYFAHLHNMNAAVYPIGVVNVTNDDVARYGLNSGSSKSNVIALAHEIDARLPGTKCATCVVDKDCDAVLNRLRTSGLLLYTDYTGMELYYFNNQTIAEYLSSVVRINGIQASDLLASLATILQPIFIIRATNESLALGLTWRDHWRQCNWRPRLIFNSNKYIDIYLSSNSRSDAKDAFEEHCVELGSSCHGDPRHFIQGHDFTESLSLYLHHRHGNRRDTVYASGDVIERILAVVVSCDLLASEAMFATLSQRVL